MLLGAVTGALAPVTFACHARYAAVAARLPGVVAVVGPGADLRGPFSRVLDLHGNLRARVAAARAVGPVSRWERAGLRRRWRVWAKGPPPPGVIARAAAAAGVEPVFPFWARGPAPDTTLLLPGAAWATKRWPLARWAGLAGRLRGRVCVLGGPGEEARVEAVAAAVGGEAIVEQGFTRTFAEMRRARVAVGGDTGLLHLAAAHGVPVVGLFGPTTPEDGFWAHRPAGQLLGRPLPCRPCSRHGGPRCPVGDHACLAGLEAADVAAALAAVAP